MSDSSEFSLENKLFCRFFMQEKWPPTMRKSTFSLRLFLTLCVCAFVWARRAGFQSAHGYFHSNLDDATSCGKIPHFLLRLLPAYVCVRRNATGVVWKFRIFVAAISGLCVCVYVCVYICATTRDATVVWKFCAFIAAISSLCVCLFALLCVWTGPGRLWGAHQLQVFLNLKLNVFSVASCHILQL